MISIPALIYLALVVLGFGFTAHRPDLGWRRLGQAVTLSLLIWGGFFKPWIG